MVEPKFTEVEVQRLCIDECSKPIVVANRFRFYLEYICFKFCCVVCVQLGDAVQHCIAARVKLRVKTENSGLCAKKALAWKAVLHPHALSD